jgi:glucose-6-phosphate 1-dehydrogenase
MNSNLLPGNAPVPAPCVVVIFGAAGDLTKRMLIPSLWHLLGKKLLPENFAILGVAQADFNDQSFRAKLKVDLKELSKIDPTPELEAFLERIYFHNGDMDGDSCYEGLTGRLAEIEKKHQTGGNRLFYLAILPDRFASTAALLGKHKLCLEAKGQWARVIVEKPFGHSGESAIKLNQDLRAVLEERQIYRIDHYLGKETVQNLMAFRF